MKVFPGCGRENADDVSFCAQCGAVLPAGGGGAGAAAPGQAAPGQAAPYYPPPPAPARRGRSPWVWVGLGCGLVSLLFIGGCLTVAFVGGKRLVEQVEQSQNQPLTEQEVRRALEGTPIYPDARVDIPMSKTLRAVASVTSGITGALTGGRGKMAAGAFRAPAPPPKVIAWYDQKFAGWQRGNAGARMIDLGRQDNENRGVEMTERRQYTNAKNGQQVQVQVGRLRGDDQNSLVTLIVISGLPAAAR